MVCVHKDSIEHNRNDMLEWNVCMLDIPTVEHVRNDKVEKCEVDIVVVEMGNQYIQCRNVVVELPNQSFEGELVERQT